MFQSDIDDERTDAREGFFAVLRKHRDHDVRHDVKLRQVRRGQVNEDVSGIQGYLATLGVDDGRKREHMVVLVIDDRINRGIANNRQVFPQMSIRLLCVNTRALT